VFQVYTTGKLEFPGGHQARPLGKVKSAAYREHASKDFVNNVNNYIFSGNDTDYTEQSDTEDSVSDAELSHSNQFIYQYDFSLLCTGCRASRLWKFNKYYVYNFVQFNSNFLQIIS
jgi:hypothetical protein